MNPFGAIESLDRQTQRAPRARSGASLGLAGGLALLVIALAGATGCEYEYIRTKPSSTGGDGGEGGCRALGEPASALEECCSGQLDELGSCCSGTGCCASFNHSGASDVPGVCTCDVGYTWSSTEESSFACAKACVDLAAPASSPQACCSGQLDDFGRCCQGSSCCAAMNHSHASGAQCACDPGYAWASDDADDFRCVSVPACKELDASCDGTTVSSDCCDGYACDCTYFGCSGEIRECKVAEGYACSYDSECGSADNPYGNKCIGGACGQCVGLYEKCDSSSDCCDADNTTCAYHASTGDFVCKNECTVANCSGFDGTCSYSCGAWSQCCQTCFGSTECHDVF